MKYEYVHKVMQRKSFPDFFMQLGCKVDWKEWSEIYGMYKFILEKCDKNNFMPDVIFDVGCGKRPTLGTFLALNVKSFNNVVCIDPQLDPSLCKDINGIKLSNRSLHDYTIFCNNDYKGKKALIVCNHSHSSKNEIINFIKIKEFSQYVYITCPCCVDNKLDNGEFCIDSKVDSPKNIYYISKNF